MNRWYFAKAPSPYPSRKLRISPGELERQRSGEISPIYSVTITGRLSALGFFVFFKNGGPVDPP